MPKMKCQCGYVFDLSLDTQDYEMNLFQQTFIEEMAELLDEGKLSGDDFFSKCVMSGRHVHPCPECGRIYVESAPRSGEFESYFKEDSAEARTRSQGPGSR